MQEVGTWVQGKFFLKKWKFVWNIFFKKVRKKMFKILGAKNRRKNLHKYPGPPFQIRGGPGSFSIADFWLIFYLNKSFSKFSWPAFCCFQYYWNQVRRAKILLFLFSEGCRKVVKSHVVDTCSSVVIFRNWPFICQFASYTVLAIQ